MAKVTSIVQLTQSPGRQQPPLSLRPISALSRAHCSEGLSHALEPRACRKHPSPRPTDQNPLKTPAKPSTSHRSVQPRREEECPSTVLVHSADVLALSNPQLLCRCFSDRAGTQQRTSPPTAGRPESGMRIVREGRRLPRRQSCSMKRPASCQSSCCTLSNPPPGQKRWCPMQHGLNRQRNSASMMKATETMH